MLKLNDEFDAFGSPGSQLFELEGVSINARIWRAANNSKMRPVLFCNGIGANLEIIETFAARIEDRDVIAFDVPGAGESEPTKFPYRMSKLARWISQLLDETGHGVVDVIGLSWGGMLAQQLAFQYPCRVNKLVLAATTPGIFMVPGKARALAKMVDFRRYADPQYLRENFEALYGEPLSASGVEYTNQVKRPRTRGYLYQMMALMGWSSLPILPLISQPILVLMGENDRVVPSINGRVISALARDAQFRMVERGGHLFLLTKSKTIAPEILDFFDA